MRARQKPGSFMDEMNAETVSERLCAEWYRVPRRSSDGGTRRSIHISSGAKPAAPSHQAIMMLLGPWAKLEQRAVCAERCKYGSGRRSAAALLTPLPIGRGFLYLVAVIDWARRTVLAWRLSNTLDTRFCIDALEEALARFGTPEIFNTDSQWIEARARSSPRLPSPADLRPPASKSRWTGVGAGWTTCSSNGCGARSNTRTSI